MKKVVIEWNTAISCVVDKHFTIFRTKSTFYEISKEIFLIRSRKYVVVGIFSYYVDAETYLKHHWFRITAMCNVNWTNIWINSETIDQILIWHGFCLIRQNTRAPYSIRYIGLTLGSLYIIRLFYPCSRDRAQFYPFELFVIFFLLTEALKCHSLSYLTNIHQNRLHPVGIELFPLISSSRWNFSTKFLKYLNVYEIF